MAPTRAPQAISSSRIESLIATSSSLTTADGPVRYAVMPSGAGLSAMMSRTARVYRSPVTVAMPMLVAGAGLGVGRPVVALLGNHHVIGVSIFASALMAVIVLGAGIDYGIFLLGRYQEARRGGADPTAAYYTALSGVRSEEHTSE